MLQSCTSTQSNNPNCPSLADFKGRDMGDLVKYTVYVKQEYLVCKGI